MPSKPSKLTAPAITARKRGPKLAVLTAYDATIARLLDEAGADILLVGDSLGMVVQGLDTTLSVTVEDICYHGRAVARAARRAHVVGDMPFMSFQASVEQAVVNAGRLVKEGSFQSVKLEGGQRVAEHVRRITEAGIPVMGHVGLTPQSVHQMGGFRIQGKTEAAAQSLLEDARALAEAGAYALVIEGVPSQVAASITQAIEIPTIGIGAGPMCDGQVLVCYDFLGMYRDLKPKFVKRYAELGDAIVAAAEQYVAEVRSGEFPAAEHSFGGARQSPEPSGTAAILEAQGMQAGYGPARDEET